MIKKKSKKASWLKPLPAKKSHKKRNIAIGAFLGSILASVFLTKGKDQQR